MALAAAQSGMTDLTPAQAVRQTQRDQNGRYAPGSTGLAESGAHLVDGTHTPSTTRCASTGSRNLYPPDAIPMVRLEKGTTIVCDPRFCDEPERSMLRQQSLIAAAYFTPPTIEEMRAFEGQQVAMLLRHPDGRVYAQEGELGVEDDGIWLADPTVDPHLPHSERHAVRVTPQGTGYQALAVAPAAESQHLASDYMAAFEQAPMAGAATFDDIPIDDGQTFPPSQVSGVYLVDLPALPGDDRPARGAIMFATDITPNEGDPIVNGYVWVPPDCPHVSESGSLYQSQIAAGHGARLRVNTDHLSTARFYRDLPSDRVGVQQYLSDDSTAPLSCPNCGESGFTTSADVAQHQASWCFGSTDPSRIW